MRANPSPYCDIAKKITDQKNNSKIYCTSDGNSAHWVFNGKLRTFMALSIIQTGSGLHA